MRVNMRRVNHDTALTALRHTHPQNSLGKIGDYSLITYLGSGASSRVSKHMCDRCATLTLSLIRTLTLTATCLPPIPYYAPHTLANVLSGKQACV